MKIALDYIDDVNAIEAFEAPPEVCWRCRGVLGHDRRVHLDGRHFCVLCDVKVCRDCGTDAPSAGAMRRGIPGVSGSPVLCTICCSRYRGREWMAS